MGLGKNRKCLFGSRYSVVPLVQVSHETAIQSHSSHFTVVGSQVTSIVLQYFFFFFFFHYSYPKIELSANQRESTNSVFLINFWLRMLLFFFSSELRRFFFLRRLCLLSVFCPNIQRNLRLCSSF